MFIPEQAADTFAEKDGYFTDTSPCWCNRTQSEVGPDDKLANLQVCGPHRSCFED